MATVPGEFYVKTASEARDDGLRTLKNGLIRAGITNPNVAPGSDYYVLLQAIGNEIEVLGANLLVKADDQMPDTATEDDLDRWLGIVGLSRRSAAGSTGSIVLSSSANTNIIVGTELLDGQGLRYQVTVGGIYANGATVPVASIDTGDLTNLAAATVLTWQSAPVYCASTVTVATGGLTGGANAEDDETARRRLLRHLSTPPGSGNWTQVAETAEASTPKVMAAFVYPSMQGPATEHVAVAAYPSDTNKTRQIDNATLTTVIQPYINGALAEHVDRVITTVTDVNTDVAIYMSLPASPAAAVPGPGGGWLDGTPFPRPLSGGNPYCDVQAVTSTTRFTVPSDVTPVANATRICWFSPVEWKLYTATVTAVNNSSSPWDITIDTPFPNIAAGHYISPQSVNQADYFGAIIESFRLMGPGEKTSNATVLARAYRRPTPNSSWPYSLGPSILRALTDVGEEVLDVQWAYRSTTTPAVPGSVNSAPNILIPRNIALYELTS